jgi:hypothetical protein
MKKHQQTSARSTLHHTTSFAFLSFEHKFISSTFFCVTEDTFPSLVLLDWQKSKTITVSAKCVGEANGRSILI